MQTDLLDKATQRTLHLGLVDILYAYAYNVRSTEGEGNVRRLDRRLCGWLQAHVCVLGGVSVDHLQAKLHPLLAGCVPGWGL